MHNGRTRKLNYKPRYTQAEAFDLLPPMVRAACREGPQEWDTALFLRRYRKVIREGVPPEVAEEALALLVWSLHEAEVRRALPWRKAGFPPGDSPHLSAGSTLLFNPANAPPGVVPA